MYIYIYIYISWRNSEKHIHTSYSNEETVDKTQEKNTVDSFWAATFAVTGQVAVSIPAPYESLRRSHGSKSNIRHKEIERIQLWDVVGNP